MPKREWDSAHAAVAIQRIARGRAARRLALRKKLHTVAGGTLLDMLENIRLYHEGTAKGLRVSQELDQLPALVRKMAKVYDLAVRAAAAKDVSFVLCEVQGDLAAKAFNLIKTSDVASNAAIFARECLTPPNLDVLYPLFAIMSNLPTLGKAEGEDLLKSSGCFSLLVDCLFSEDIGVQYYAVAAVSNMSHDLEAVAIVKDRKATHQLESLLDSNNRHIINFSLKALENVNEVQGAFDFLFKSKKREIADRKLKMESARIKYRTLSDNDARRALAATSIQKWVRGFLARRGLLGQSDIKVQMAAAATRIQAAARGKITRTNTAKMRARLRALKIKAGVSRVTQLHPRLKTRVKANRARVLQAGGNDRVARVRALVERLQRVEACRPVHVPMVLDATRLELETLEAHADAPTPECLAILADLRRRYALACAGGGPVGLERLERTQPLVAKFERAPGVVVHAAMLLFASKTELGRLEGARSPDDPVALAILARLRARFGEVQASGIEVSATEYEAIQALVRALERADPSVHAHMLLMAGPPELASLDGVDPRSAEARRLLLDLRLRAELSIAAVGSRGAPIIAALRAGQSGLSAAHAGVLCLGSLAELRSLQAAWLEETRSFGEGVAALLGALHARYAIALAAALAEQGHVPEPELGQTRPVRAQLLFSRFEREVPQLLVHAGTLIMCTLSELLALEQARDVHSRESATVLTDARVRLELAHSTGAVPGAETNAALSNKRLERAQPLVVKYADVPFVHSGIVVLGTKPELKRLDALDSEAAEALDILELLRLKHERLAMQLVAAKRAKQTRLANDLSKDARVAALAGAVRPTIQKQVVKTTAVAVHTQAVARGNEARKLAAAKRERQNALSHAQQVFPVYSRALAHLGSGAVEKRTAATVVQARFRGKLARDLAAAKGRRQQALRGAGSAMPAATSAARRLRGRAMSRTEAATTIQRYWRGHSARAKFKLRLAIRRRAGSVLALAPAVYAVPIAFESALRRRQAAAVVIQRYARGRSARVYTGRRRAILEDMGQLAKLYPVLREARSAVLWLSKKRHLAAIQIQRHWRGFSDRRRVRKLLTKMARLYRVRQEREYVLQLDAHMYKNFSRRKQRQAASSTVLPPLSSAAARASTAGRNSTGLGLRTAHAASYPSLAKHKLPLAQLSSLSYSDASWLGPEQELETLRHMPRTLKANVAYYPGRAYIQAMHSLPSTPSRKYVNTERGQSLLEPLARLPHGLETHLAASLHVPSFRASPPEPPGEMLELAYGHVRRSPKKQLEASRKLANSP